MVLCDEYRINGVNAMCKRAIAPTALPASLFLSLSLPLSLAHFLFLFCLQSDLLVLQVIVCLLLAPIARPKREKNS